MASDAGAYRAISSPTRAWISARRRSRGIPAAVWITPSSRADSREPAAQTTPYPVLAVPGSMPRTTTRGDSAHAPGRLPQRGHLPKATFAPDNWTKCRYAGCMLRRGQQDELLREVTFLRQRVAELEADRARGLRLDSVTGLLSARAFRGRLSEEVERARRYQRALTIVVISIDDFGLLELRH